MQQEIIFDDGDALGEQILTISHTQKLIIAADFKKLDWYYKFPQNKNSGQN